MDGTNLTEADLINVFSKMPFLAEDVEAQNSHELLLKELANADSPVQSANAKPAAVAVIQRIQAHIESKGNESPKILSHIAKAQM